MPASPQNAAGPRMEPPVSLEPDAIRDEKVKVLQALRVITPEKVRESTVRAYLELNHPQAGRWVPPAPIRVDPTGQEVVVTFAPRPATSK